jgi:beta-lactamase regulating signal transducer with metallopeptidase domain
MTIGASIFLIAVGAILKYAVNATVSGIEIQTIGLILMVAGAVGLLIGLFLLTQADRRRDVVYDDRDRLRDRDPVVR